MYESILYYSIWPVIHLIGMGGTSSICFYLVILLSSRWVKVWQTPSVILHFFLLHGQRYISTLLSIQRFFFSIYFSNFGIRDIPYSSKLCNYYQNVFIIGYHSILGDYLPLHLQLSFEISIAVRSNTCV